MPDNVKLLLEDMYRRPGVYFGKKSLEALSFTLGGYMLREREIDKESGSWFSGFQDFVARYYRVEASRGWCDIIRFFSATEEEAFDKFYQLLKEYLEA